MRFINLMGLTIFFIICCGCISTNPSNSTQLDTIKIVPNQLTQTISTVTKPVSESTQFITYHDPSIGFSLDYPSNWTVKTILLNQNDYATMFIPPPPNQNYTIIISVYANLKEMDVKQWANGIISDSPQIWPEFALIDIKDTKISEVPAVTFEFTGKDKKNTLFHIQDTLAIEGNYGYSLMYVSTPDLFPKYLGTYQKVFNSFMFP